MKTLITLTIILAAIAVSAQDNHGFYGKTAYVEVTSSSYIPLIYNLTTQSGYKRVSKTSDALGLYKRPFHMGFRASIGQTIKSHFGIALEVGFDRYMLNEQFYGSIPNPYYPGSNITISKHESVKVNSYLIMPKMEFAGANGLLPNGLVHQVGFGVTINKPVDKEYVVQVNNNNSWEPLPAGYQPPSLGEFIDLAQSANTYRFMYGLKMRTPLSKSLMINYGIRYTLDFGLSLFGADNMSRAIREYQFRNLIAFDLGITMPF